ncbi:MAG: tyrosine-type recombinase/integrase [Elusimicrobia bacterium]|nr:tyrosine-type recombinase/integrase [Elusimicrobiota bacterium]
MSIFKKRGKWWILYRLPTGKWRREPVGNNYALAKEVEAKRKTEVAAGKHFPERITNKKPFQFISDLYFKLHGSNLRSGSWKNMARYINKHLGTKPIGNISPQDIQCFYNQIESETSTSTANRHLTLIKAIFNKAKTWDNFHGENPCAAVKKKLEPNHRLRYLSNEEIRTLIANCHHRLYPFVACALMTGMRKSELLNLDWRDIDFTSNTLQILQSKSGKVRKIPIMPQLKQILSNLSPKPSGNVFNLPDITLKRHFAIALKTSGIDSFRIHDLRHTFASHFAMRTGDLPTLQQILGHANIQMTMRYAHLSDKHMSDKMAILSKTLTIKNCTKTARVAPLIAPPRISALSNIVELPMNNADVAQW